MYEMILARFYNQPHCLAPEKLMAIHGVLRRRLSGVRADSELLSAMRADNQSRRRSSMAGSVAVLPIIGTIVKRGGLMEESSGFASTDAIGRQLDALLADESVGSILLDVDSPGGETFGVQELAEKIFNARSRKPIEASVNPDMGSGALWIGTAADKVNITPSGWIGSLGVYMAHVDTSVQNEALGEKVTYISAGDYKVEGASEAPLSDEARAYYQSQVDSIYDQFTKAVAKHRGTTTADVKANYGKGRMLLAKDAKAVGMVDRIEAFEETVKRMAGGGRTAGKSKAARLLELEGLR